MRASATAPTSRAPRRCRRICDSARTARGRSGTARFAAAERPALAADTNKFLSELGWREFCRHLLFDESELATRNMQAAFDAFPWRRDDRALRAWPRGRTRYAL